MMLANRVRERTKTQGTGDIVLDGAVRGHARFQDAVDIGTLVPYVLDEGDQVEIGEGRLIGLQTFRRERVSQTVVGGALSDIAPTHINLTGNAQLYIALTEDAWATKLDTAGGTVSGSLTIGGDLTVAGETTYLTSNTLNIGDNILTLNADVPATMVPVEDAGIMINRGSAQAESFVFREADQSWVASTDLSVEGRFSTQAGATVEGVLSANASLSVAGSTSIGEGLNVAGSVTASAGLNVAGLVDVDGSVAATGSVTVGGAMTAVGAATFGSVTTEGALSADAASFGTSVGVLGSLTVEGQTNAASLTVSNGAELFGESVGVHAPIIMDASALIDGGLSVSGGVQADALTVVQATSLGADTNIFGALRVEGAATVLSDAELSGALSVAGQANLAHVDVSNTTTLGGLATLLGGLNVSGMSALEGLAVSGDFTAAGTATIAGNTVVGGAFSCASISTGDVSVTGNLVASNSIQAPRVTAGQNVSIVSDVSRGYLQAGSDLNDTDAELRIVRRSTIDQPINNFHIYTNFTRITGTLTVAGGLIAEQGMTVAGSVVFGEIGRLTTSNGVTFLQSGTDQSDTNAELRVSRSNTTTLPLKALRMYAEEAYFSGSVALDAGGLRVTASSFGTPTATTNTLYENSGIFIKTFDAPVGAGVLNGGVTWGRAGSDRPGAAILSYQPTADPDQIGLKFYTRLSTTTSNDALFEAMDLDHAGDLTIAGTFYGDHIELRNSVPNLRFRSQDDLRGYDIIANVNDINDFGLQIRNLNNVPLGVYRSDGRYIHYGDSLFSADNIYDLGSASERANQVWAANGAIQTSDRNIKTDIRDISLGLDFISALRPVDYRLADMPAQYDEEGRELAPAQTFSRTHSGLIAQEVKETLDAFGCDRAVYIEPETGPRGLRYEELIAPLIKAVQQLSAQLEKAEARLAVLEAGGG